MGRGYALHQPIDIDAKSLVAQEGVCATKVGLNLGDDARREGQTIGEAAPRPFGAGH